MNAASEFVQRLTERLRAAHEGRTSVGPLDLSPHQRVLAHVPEDLTVTVETGITLGALQSALGARGQWLPLDPAGVESLTIRELLDHNLSGPHRFGCGTARDWLIGLKAVLADGRVIESGGKVVKNVAGYDLHKLLIGARGDLGVIVEATFKIAPLPSSEVILSADVASQSAGMDLCRALLNAPVNPVVLDLVRRPGDALQCIVGFAGTARETMWQREQIAGLADWRPASLDYDAEFIHALNGRRPGRISVLPERLAATLASLDHPRWIARAGNGVIYHPPDNSAPAPAEHPLAARIRALFDPHGVFGRSP